QFELIGPPTKRVVGHETFSRSGTRETFLLVPSPLRATLSRRQAPQGDQLGGGQVTSASRSDGKGQLQRRQVGLVGDRPGTMILRRPAGSDRTLMSTGHGSHDPRSTRAPRDLGMPDDNDRTSGIADHVPRDAPEEHLSSYFVRSDGLDNTDASEFCDPTIDTQIARVDAMQATDP